LRSAPRRNPPPSAIHLVVDKRIPVCIVRGEYSIATLDSWLTVGGNLRPLDQVKIDALTYQIRMTGKVPGTFGLGTYDGKQYLLDGRHRREAVRRSGRSTVHAVIAWVKCELR
jgi:hypothetical protein